MNIIFFNLFYSKIYNFKIQSLVISSYDILVAHFFFNFVKVK